jgi:arylsulfatase
MKMSPDGNRRRNIVFLVVDALRPDVLDIEEPVELTPYLNHMRRKGFFFNNAYATINTTDPSLTSIFSGRYPRFHGIINHGSKVSQEEKREYLLRVLRTLPQLLQQSGYRTMAVDWLGRWHRRGFQIYGDAAVSGKGPRRILHEVNKRLVSLRLLTNRKAGGNLVTSPASNIVDYAIRLLKDSPRPFFLFVHFWDTHVPYYSPEAIKRGLAGLETIWLRKLPDLETGEMLSGIKNPVWRYYMKAVSRGSKSTWDISRNYLASVNYTDREVGKLLSYLENNGLMQDTLVVSTSDHGESMGEHGIWFDHHGLYEPTVRVPLILYSPGLIPEGSTSTALVQHVDLLPTIIDLLGLKERVASDGISMAKHILKREPFSREFAIIEEAHAQRNIAVIHNGLKLIKRIGGEDGDAVCGYCRVVHCQEEELYDLHDDPFETQNLLDQRDDQRDDLYSFLERWSIDMEMKRMVPGV